MDVTEHRTQEGKRYLCAVKEVFSRGIVGYSISDCMKARIAIDAVNNAASSRGHVTGCIVYSDRGSQFRSRKFLRTLENHGLVGSMGRVGAAGDKSAFESFFALLQNNVLNRRAGVPREQLGSALLVWIEKHYHRKRRQAALGRLTPIELETMMATPVALPASQKLSPRPASDPKADPLGAGCVDTNQIRKSLLSHARTGASPARRNGSDYFDPKERAPLGLYYANKKEGTISRK